MPIKIDPRTLEQPAIFVNCFEATRLGDVLMRLTLGEAPTPNDRRFRVAVLMHMEDVRRLIDILQRLSSLPVAGDAPRSRPN
jgi:hypothetical protein